MTFDEGGCSRDIPWTFQNPVEISFGAGARSAMTHHLPEQGTVLLVSTPAGRKRILQDEVMAPLARNPKVAWMDDVSPNPDIMALQAQIDSIRDMGVTAIFAIGGSKRPDRASPFRNSNHGRDRKRSYAICNGLGSWDQEKIFPHLTQAFPSTCLSRPGADPKLA